MNIKDMIISAFVKKGVLMEARNYEMEFEVPAEEGKTTEPMKIKIKCDHIKITIEKE